MIKNPSIQSAPGLRPRAVVIGMESFTALQTARILAGHGVPVIGIGNDPQRAGCKTNVCEKLILGDTNGPGLIDTLCDLGPSLDQKAVLIPCSDLSVLLISEHRETLRPWYRIHLPEHDIVDLLMSKTRFAAFAQEVGLPIPKTFLLRNRNDVAQAAAELIYPAILKPAVKTPTWVARTGGAKLYNVASAEDLLGLYDHCNEWAGELIAQEWVDGAEADLYSCNCYFNAASEPLITFIARKIRQWPPRTGIASSSVEHRNDDVLETSLRLFKSVDYQGLGYLEMKRDARTGQHVIIEPNIGRPTGRSAIAEAGGVELIYTAYCDTAGLPLPDNRQQKYGRAKWIYWRRDLQSALYYIRHGELSIKDWLCSLRGKKRSAVFSWRDPKPFWFDLIYTVRRQLRGNKQKQR